MLEIIVCIVGGLYLLATGDTEVKSSSKQKIEPNKRTRWDNSTTYEIDKYLKENNMYNEYGGYGREAKIQKLVDKDR